MEQLIKGQKESIKELEAKIQANLEEIKKVCIFLTLVSIKLHIEISRKPFVFLSSLHTCM